MNTSNVTSIAEQISHHIIPHTAYANVVNGCLDIIDMGMRTNRANKGMAIMGHGGTGKTTAIEQIEQYVNKKYAGKFNRPVIRTTITSDTNVKSFYLDILEELCHPVDLNKKDATAARLQRIVVNSLKGNVCTLIIDEVSDVFSNRHKNQFAMDFLVMIKHLLSDTLINIILVGTPTLNQLFSMADAQFRTRFPTVYELPKFKKDEEWIRLLNAHEDMARNIIDLSILPPLYSQLHDWTEGNLRNFSDLLNYAIYCAEIDGGSTLTLEHLEKAQKSIFPTLLAA